MIARLSHLGIARNVPRKPRRSRRGGKNERRRIKVGFCDRLPSDSSSCPTPCRQPAELDFYHFSSALRPHSDECQHTTSVPPSSPPSDRDDLTAFSLSVPLRPSHRQLLHISLSSSSLLVCLFNARSVGTSRRRSDISTFIQDNNIDIMLLTETWLRQPVTRPRSPTWLRLDTRPSLPLHSPYKEADALVQQYCGAVL